MPSGGFFDRESAALANALVGNGPGARALEIGLQPLRFKVTEPVVLAFVGAECRITRDGQEVAGQASIDFKSGDQVEVTARGAGSRLYLAAPGGLGGRTGEQVKNGLRIEMQGVAKPMRLADGPTSLSSSEVRVVLGPQAELFDEALLGQTFKVSPLANRVGVRLEGEGTPHNHELPSEPACPGTVQITPSGNPIVLGPDGPTIGGYPKAAVVISADLDKVGQWKMGDEIQFRIVSIEEAQSAAAERKRILDKKCREIHLIVDKNYL